MQNQFRDKDECVFLLEEILIWGRQGRGSRRLYFLCYRVIGVHVTFWAEVCCGTGLSCYLGIDWLNRPTVCLSEWDPVSVSWKRMFIKCSLLLFVSELFCKTSHAFTPWTDTRANNESLEYFKVENARPVGETPLLESPRLGTRTVGSDPLPARLALWFTS